MLIDVHDGMLGDMMCFAMQEAVLRKYGNSDGEVKVLQPVRLSDFIQISSQRRPLRGMR